MVPVFWSGFSAPIRVSCALVRQFVYRLMTIRRSISAYSHDMAVYDIQAILSLNGKYIEEIAIACCEGKITGHIGPTKRNATVSRTDLSSVHCGTAHVFNRKLLCKNRKKTANIEKKSKYSFSKAEFIFLLFGELFYMSISLLHTHCLHFKQEYRHCCKKLARNRACAKRGRTVALSTLA